LYGDFNGDARVDMADYVVWRKGRGTAYTQNDYDAWRAHYGQTYGTSAASTNAAAPEPAATSLLVIVMAAWWVRRGR
jgi:hypothetical protein